MTTAVREKPILFSAPMIRAILDGRKSVTRRVMKPQPEKFRDAPHCRWRHKTGLIACESGDRPSIYCPYGVGDSLWVRETWMPLWDSGAGFFTCLCPTGHEDRPDTIKYRADGEKPDNFGANWRPAIHMPRWASRITLEITDVRCERLQEITEADAEAEGFHREGCGGEGNTRTFHRLWNELNGKRGYGWHQNPWVWVLEFRRLEDAT